MNTDLNLKMYYVHVYSGDSETPFATFVFPCRTGAVGHQIWAAAAAPPLNAASGLPA